MELECSEGVLELNSPPRRRRSSFFERRDTIVPAADDMHSDIERAAKEHKKHQYLQDISRYYIQLYKEKEAWKNEARERRHQCHDIKSQLKAAATGSLSTSINYSVLTNEDLEFLRGKPNISKIAESALDLKNQVTVTMHLMKRLKEVNEERLTECEERVDSVQKYIFENSTIEPFRPTADNLINK